MIRITVKKKGFDVLARMRAAVVGPQMVDAIQKETALFTSRVQRNQMTGRPGLNVQSGGFRGSWFPETKVVAGEIRTRTFSDHPGARVHQYGAVIVPRTRRFLRFKVGQRVVFSKRVVIPKRLTIIETYQAEMPERYKRAIGSVIEQAKGRG